MGKSALKYVALVLALMTAVGVGAAIGGGIVYAATKVGARTPAVAAAIQVDPDAGLVIVSVDPEGPAAAAGVVRGDILQAIDDQAVDDLHDVSAYLAGREAGDQVELTIVHGDDVRQVTVTLGERNGIAYLGLSSCGVQLQGRMIERPIFGSGATVVEVVAGSPAEQAGLHVGDRITAVNGQEIDAEHDLADLISAHEPGDTVTLEVARPGEEDLTVVVALGQHPEEASRAFLGVTYLPMPHIGIPEGQELPFRVPQFDREPFPNLPGSELTQGAIILEVAEDSPAAAAGLEEGYVITAIDGEPITSPQALAEAIADHEPGDTVTLTVLRSEDEEPDEMEITLAEHPEKEGVAYLGVVIGGSFHRWRYQGPESPESFESPGRWFFRFRPPLDNLPFNLDDYLRRFEFRFPPQQFEMEQLAPPDEGA